MWHVRAGLAVILLVIAPIVALTKPNRLHKGDTVGLISPSSPYSYLEPNAPVYLETLSDELTQLGFGTIKYGQNMNDTWGYLAGHDNQRIQDIHTMFSDPQVKVCTCATVLYECQHDSLVQIIVANRGGYGCARLIDKLDYNLIQSNTKIIMGYSDLTACITAIHFMTGLVTFYGPMGVDNWLNYNGFYAQKILFEGAAMTLQNPPNSNLSITTINGGKAKGRIYGGNLSVFASLVGSKYLPSGSNVSFWENSILFLEDVYEEPYTVDRMLTTLHLSGILDSVAGFVWGTCNECAPPIPSQSLTMAQVINDKIAPLKIPAFSGAMIGHIDQQFTIPLGIFVEIDADQGTITMLESAVVGVLVCEVNHKGTGCRQFNSAHLLDFVSHPSPNYYLPPCTIKDYKNTCLIWKSGQDAGGAIPNDCFFHKGHKQRANFQVDGHSERVGWSSSLFFH